MSKIVRLFGNLNKKSTKSSNKYEVHNSYTAMKDNQIIIKPIITIEKTTIFVVPTSLENTVFKYSFFQKLDYIDTINNIYLFSDSTTDEIFNTLNNLNMSFKNDWYIAPKIYINQSSSIHIESVIKWILATTYTKINKITEFYFICDDTNVNIIKKNIINNANLLLTFQNKI